MTDWLTLIVSIDVTDDEDNEDEEDGEDEEDEEGVEDGEDENLNKVMFWNDLNSNFVRVLPGNKNSWLILTHIKLVAKYGVL